MQIFWVSGPVGQIRSINVTLKNLIIAGGGIACTLIILGIAFQYAGFRMAVEYNPELARKLGDLHTAAEIENLNSFYQSRLTDVRKQLENYSKKVTELELANEKLVAIATPHGISKNNEGPSPSRTDCNHATTWRSSNSLFDDLANALLILKRKNRCLSESLITTSSQISWLASKPIGYPLKQASKISSPFGMRADPIMATQAPHQGVDFQVPNGSPILSAAAGVVKKVGKDSNYGNAVIVDHGGGYSTRYAHISEALVLEGQQIGRLTPIAKVGSSGKSTGPHLHFEIIKDGRYVDPKIYLIGLK